MRNTKKYFLFAVPPLLLIFALATLPACPAIVAGGAAAGGYFYVDGEAQRVVDKPYNRTYKSVKDTLKKLGMPIIKITRTEKTSEIKSEFGDGKTAVVKLRNIDSESTQIGIRVGVIGDENRAKRLMDKIVKRL